MTTIRPILLLFVLLTLLFHRAQPAAAQCANWSATAHLVAGATCAGNGSFTVQLQGPDAVNLTNVQYGIPLSVSGFSVPLSSSPTFTSMPPGTFQVSVVATCGTATIGRNATITVPGTYTTPSWDMAATSTRASISCGATGAIGLAAKDGFPTYRFNLTAYPASYTGPTTYISTSSYGYFDNLPPGSYTVQAVDSCRSGTAPLTLTVAALNFSTAPLSGNVYRVRACDTILIYPPNIQSSALPWYHYTSSYLFQTSYHIPGITTPSAPSPMGYYVDTLVLPAGKTVKDLYGRMMNVTFYPPCGPSRTISVPLESISGAGAGFQPLCDSSLNVTLYSALNACLPLTYYLRNQTNGRSYGPYVVNNTTRTISGLPAGNYRYVYTTADGYSDSAMRVIPPVGQKPYYISVIPGLPGLNNWIGGFWFVDSSGVGGPKTVELFSGPAGYTHRSSWSGDTYGALHNHSGTAATLRFPPGNYVWKVTDGCGVYYLPITVTSADLHTITSGPVSVTRLCDGVSVLPSGTVSRGGQSLPVWFVVYRNGFLYTVPGYGRSVPAGVPIKLTLPGTYTFFTSGSSSQFFGPGQFPPTNVILGLPNNYNASTSYVFSVPLLGIDLNQTQGFLCAGSAPGSARIDVRGKGGIPLPGGSYNYYLALRGNGAAGPYLDSNTTGLFTGFGGNANGLYDIKVKDSCEAFAVQEVRILDLGISRLAVSSKYVGCIGDSITLSAAFLPGASYSWTGPNGFSSSLRQPLIFPAGTGNSGIYRVRITTTACNGVFPDSVRVVVNPDPPKPLLDYLCMPRPVRIRVLNPAPGTAYRWGVGFPDGLGGYTYSMLLSDSLYTKRITYVGRYSAVATDSLYGCSSRSDTLAFLMPPNEVLKAGIYTPHAQICTGDSTILSATWNGTWAQPVFRWLRNGSPIGGATGISYTASIPGQYRVIIDAGICNRDTSAAITVNVVPLPPDSLSASRTTICLGDTAWLAAAQAPGYHYAWELGGVQIPGAHASRYPARQPGRYTVLTSNGACLTRSAAVTIDVLPALDPALFPVGLVRVCSFLGDTAMPLIARKDTSWSYRWYRNGVLLPGDTLHRYTPRQPGRYHVVVSSAFCGANSSDTAIMIQIPVAVHLGNDTLICDANRFPVRLQADSGFTTYRWSTGETGRFAMAPGTGYYSIVASNQCGTFGDTVRIGNGDDFLAKFPDDTLVCTSTQRLILSLPAGLSSIRWNTDERTSSVYVDTPGLYYFRAMSPCGPVSDSIRVRFCLPEIRNVEGLGPICEGQCIWPRAKADGYPESYEWYFEGGNPATASGAGAKRICYDKAGDHRLMLVTSNKGGKDTAIYNVSVLSRPELRFRDTVVLAAYNIPVRLPACAEAHVADWYENGRLICENCAELPLTPKNYQSVYHCVVRNGDCPDSCSYALRVLDIPNNIWLPTGFTPNNDGLNDRFGIISDNPNIKVGNLSVYNRWGQRVFLSNRNDEGWDGSFKGVPAEAGVYFWQLSYRILGRDETLMQKGDVTLVR